MSNIVSQVNVCLNKLIFLIVLFLSFQGQGFAEHPLMTLDEKIGQLFVIPACQLRGDDHWEDLQRLMRKAKRGGLF